MLFLLLFGVYAAWYLQRLIYRKYWNHRLDVDVRFMDSYVYEGDKTTLREEISDCRQASDSDCRENGTSFCDWGYLLQLAGRYCRI